MVPPDTALIVIDLYNDFLHPSGKLNYLLSESLKDTSAIENLQKLVDAARNHDIPIFYGLHQQYRPGFIAGWQHATPMQQSQRDSTAFEEGSWGAEVYEGLQPDCSRGDVVISKHWCSNSFQNTDLDYQLRQRNITNLVLAGMTANSCLEATARSTYEQGYYTTMLKDATAGFTREQKDAATELIWPLFANKVTTVEDWIKTMD